MIAVSPSRIKSDRVLEPGDFCRKYCIAKESEYPYKGKWARFLAYVLEISVKTVESWGSAPDFPRCDDRYKRRLAEIDALKTAEAVLRDYGLSQEYLEKLDLSGDDNS